ncbi:MULTISPECIES: rod-binding protein [unclassified Treponema]|uniref:rod-binding protein n=1 Tax=unclassified Treponema TaxID=2638727 RepID=UPI0020A530A3|nr:MULTISPECIES: rod-binding protein [unclassified Treponema]UTC66196.1 rod-binding protein [Treponema sp. OMZ 789]UTC68925.1 rod-binding protein [Treponema sp. OMZ 790]UTC71653.1 rod-binding protein [Treponema sp. OMZ 791]
MEVNKIQINQTGREDVKNSLINKKEIPSSVKSQQNFGQMLETLRGSERASSVISNIQGESSASVSGLKTGQLFDTRLPGDILKSMKIENPVPADTHREIQGMASSFGKSGETVHSKYSIDRTSKLYEQALEFESYFVKIMLDSMRSTLSGKTLAGDESFAGKMYQDMMYDELGRSMTKNAGFGLADQIYLELSGKK